MTECLLLLAFRVLGNQYANFSPSFQIILENESCEKTQAAGGMAPRDKGPRYQDYRVPPPTVLMARILKCICKLTVWNFDHFTFLPLKVLPLAMRIPSSPHASLSIRKRDNS